MFGILIFYFFVFHSSFFTFHNFGFVLKWKTKSEKLKALKECSESLYWLELFKRVNYKIENIDKLISDCNEIKALLISSINTAKKSN